MIHAHWLTRVYLAFLALFPAAYREDYGDELAYAIRSAVADATAEGGQALAKPAWRELRDLPRPCCARTWRNGRYML